MYGRLDSVTGVILAGGPSSRMGSNKALLPHQGGLFIETIYRLFCQLFSDVLLVTNAPEQYGFVPCRKIADQHTGAGPLAGIHAALSHCTTEFIFVAACDMPCLNPELISYLAGRAPGFDVVIPAGDKGLEALHAIYSTQALPAISTALAAGRRRIVSFFDDVRVCQVECSDVARFDQGFRSFHNINTPEEYYRLREEQRAVRAEPVVVPRRLRNGCEAVG
jgi:molybdopterin-guanine dinucleotide biosynthesis protein A